MNISQSSYRYNRKRRAPFKKILFAGLFFCLLGALIYLIFFTSYFLVRQVDVSYEPEMKYVAEERVRQVVAEKMQGEFWGLISNKHLILLAAEDIKDELMFQYPQIESVMIEKQYPARLDIDIRERQGIGLWCRIERETRIIEQPIATSTSDIEQETAPADISKIVETKVKDCFLIDKHGIIFEPSAHVKGTVVLNIYSEQGDVKLSEQVVDESVISGIISIKELSTDLTIDNQRRLNIASFEIASPEDIRAKTDEDWEIYFNPTYSIAKQVDALKQALEKEIQGQRSSLQYVDLRIENRAYYK